MSPTGESGNTLTSKRWWLDEDEERMKPYLTYEGLKAGCMHCNNASTCRKRERLTDIEMDELSASYSSKCFGNKLGKKATEKLNDGRKKSRHSVYDHVLLLLQSCHGRDISFTEKKVVLQILTDILSSFGYYPSPSALQTGWVIMSTPLV